MQFLRRMQNRRLVKLRSDYDALTQYLDQDYREDEGVARTLSELVKQLIKLNYPPDGLEDVLDWNDGFTSADIERRLTRFRLFGVDRQEFFAKHFDPGDGPVRADSKLDEFAHLPGLVFQQERIQVPVAQRKINPWNPDYEFPI